MMPGASSSWDKAICRSCGVQELYSSFYDNRGNLADPFRTIAAYYHMTGMTVAGGDEDLITKLNSRLRHALPRTSRWAFQARSNLTRVVRPHGRVADEVGMVLADLDVVYGRLLGAGLNPADDGD
jgi:hypothetical protein